MNVFAHETFAQLLRDAVAGQSLRALAKALGFGQASALSRVVNGERAASAAFIERLAGHLQLDPEAREFVHCLAQAQDSSDVGLRRASGLRSRQIRIAHWPKSQSGHLLSLRGGQSLVVWFRVDPTALDKTLEPLGLQCASLSGFASVNVSFNVYRATPFGTHQELLVSVMAKPKDGDLSKAGAYLPLLVGTNAAYCATQRMFWDNGYRQGDVRVAFAPDRVIAEADAARFTATFSGATDYREAHELWCIAGQFVPSWSRMGMRTSGVRMACDPAQLEVRLAAPLDALLGQAVPYSVMRWDTVDLDIAAPV